jgi:hypothetical protein
LARRSQPEARFTINFQPEIDDALADLALLDRRRRPVSSWQTSCAKPPLSNGSRASRW